MKTILLPIKLGNNTLGLFQNAQSIASEKNASLILLHVIRKQPYDNGTFSPDTDIHHQVVREAKMILEQLSRSAIRNGILARVMVVDGNPAEQIVNVAKKNRVDLILIDSPCGKHGCISEQVLTSSPCSVLTLSAESNLVAA